MKIQSKNVCLFILNNIKTGGMSVDFLRFAEFLHKKNFKIIVAHLNLNKFIKNGHQSEWSKIAKIVNLKGKGSLRKLSFFDELNNFLYLSKVIKKEKVNIIFSSCQWSRYLIFALSKFHNFL
ncbi:hypothetical protein OAT23_06290, partial [Candidatus Pelagibacter sp.]|nr:hypothetical protein [Candidatus Pelagibacter sp.]